MFNQVIVVRTDKNIAFKKTSHMIKPCLQTINPCNIKFAFKAREHFQMTGFDFLKSPKFEVHTYCKDRGQRKPQFCTTTQTPK